VEARDSAMATAEWDDPLLGCLAIVSGLLDRPASIETLKAGLPLHENRMTPALFVRAARQAGFVARAARRARLAEISPINLPCILVLADGGACVLVGLNGEMAEILSPESGGGAQSLPIAALQARASETVIFVRAVYAPDARAGHTPTRGAGDWFWSALTDLWPI